MTPWVHTAFALKANHEIPCQPLLPPFCNDTGEMYWVWQLNRSLVVGSKPCNLKVQIEIFIIGGLSFWYGNFPNLNLLLVWFSFSIVWYEFRHLQAFKYHSQCSHANFPERLPHQIPRANQSIPWNSPTASEPQKEALVSSTPPKMNGWNPQITYLERKMIWTKPPFLDMFQSLIFQGVSWQDYNYLTRNLPGNPR